MDDITWIKLNVFLRFGVLAVLIFIGLSVLYFKYGYEDPDDSEVNNLKLNLSVSCREALIYYAEKVWNVNKQIEEDIKNFSNLNITFGT